MNRNLGRTLAATAGALALVISGVSLAAAADSVPANPKFGGTFNLITDSNAAPVTTPFGWSEDLVASFVAADQGLVFPADASSTGAWTFLAPQGSEYNVSTWAAKNDQGGEPVTGLSYVNITPEYQTTPGTSTQGAVRAAGGNWSLGLAYTSNGDLTVDKVYFIHININASTGAWTYSPVAPEPLTTTTTVTAPATATEGANVPISATVAPAAATGTVQFKDGAGNIGSPIALSGGAASTTISAITAGSHSITAVYSGDSASVPAYATSTSAASVINIGVTPIITTTSVTAIPDAVTNLGAIEGKPVDLTATLTPAAATGSVTFTGSKDGGAPQPIAANIAVTNGTATTEVSSLSAGSWVVTATFTGTGAYQTSSGVSSALLLAPDTSLPTDTDDQTVKVTIPDGAITITTPYTPSNPFLLGTAVLDSATSTYSASANFPTATDPAIKITDTRSGQPGFTASVISSDFVTGTATNQRFSGGYAGLTGLVSAVPSGNLFNGAALTLTNIAPVSPGMGSARTFASYAAGNPTGTVDIRGILGIAGVPTSVRGGEYTATLTFTAV